MPFCLCLEPVEQPTMPDADLRMLILDGGGVRGLSSLIILRRLMAADPDPPPKACDAKHTRP